MIFTLIILLVTTLPWTSDLQLIKTVPPRGHYFSTDNLQNCYLIDHKNEIFKFNAKGKQIATFSKKTYGAPAYIDCTNPLKLLILYPDYSYIVVTDNYFSPQRTIDLSELNIERAPAACLSYDNQIWVYDERSYKLRKINQNLNFIESSEDLSSIISPSFSPHFMVSHQQQIYLNDSTRGIFVFDVYGKYKKRIPIKGLSHFQLQGSYLVYFKSPHLIRYHTKTLEKDTISLPAVKNIEDVQIQQERMYILRNNRLSLFER